MWLPKASNVFVVQEITESPLEVIPAQVELPTTAVLNLSCCQAVSQ